MDFEEKYSLRLFEQPRLSIQSGFSIDKFIEENRGKISSISNGMNDKDFPLEEDFSGKIDFPIFYMSKSIYPTYRFLLDAKAEGYIFTGVKGLASLFLNHRDSLLKNSWVLSPNRTLPAESDRRKDAIPYWSMSVDPHFVNLHHSSNSVFELMESKYILFGKKVL